MTGVLRTIPIARLVAPTPRAVAAAPASQTRRAQAPGLPLAQTPGFRTSHSPGGGEDGGRSRPGRFASDAGTEGTAHPRAVMAADRVLAAGGADHCVDPSERLNRLSVAAPASGRGSGG